MALSANKIKMCRQKEFIPIRQMLDNNGTSDVSGIDATATLEEVGTSGIVALEMATGEEVKGLILIPSNADRNNKIRFKVVYSSASTTAADDFNFTLTAVGLAPNGTDAITATPAALDTPIPADTKGNTTGNALQATESGVMNGGTLSDDDLYMVVNLEATTADTAVDVYGIELEFTPKFYKGHIVEAPAWQNDN